MPKTEFIRAALSPSYRADDDTLTMQSFLSESCLELRTLCHVTAFILQCLVRTEVIVQSVGRWIVDDGGQAIASLVSMALGMETRL